MSNFGPAQKRVPIINITIMNNSCYSGTSLNRHSTIADTDDVGTISRDSPSIYVCKQPLNSGQSLLLICFRSL